MWSAGQKTNIRVLSPRTAQLGGWGWGNMTQVNVFTLGWTCMKYWCKEKVWALTDETGEGFYRNRIEFSRLKGQSKGPER